MTSVPHSVSLRDADATSDELEALRGVMRSDEPDWDEPPTLEDSYYPPSDEDSAWWAEASERDLTDAELESIRRLGLSYPGDCLEWASVDLEPLPRAALSDDHGGFTGWGPGVDPC
jgi:hypothetical protein